MLVRLFSIVAILPRFPHSRVTLRRRGFPWVSHLDLVRHGHTTIDARPWGARRPTLFPGHPRPAGSQGNLIDRIIPGNGILPRHRYGPNCLRRGEAVECRWG